jgi:hypothetical protein
VSQPDGIDPIAEEKDNEMQKSGWKPNLYAQVDFRFFFFFFLWTVNIFSKIKKKMSQYLIKSLPYNSWITLNGFWYKETDKGGQKSDKKRPKSL